jgi:hypothetical protein
VAEHDTLELRLAALGDDLFPPTPPLRAKVIEAIHAGTTARVPRRAWRWPVASRRRATAVAAAVIAAVTVATVPTLRTAVAGFFHLPGVTIERQTTPPTAPATAPPSERMPPTPIIAGNGMFLGDAVGLDAARARLAFTPLLPSSLGSADVVYLRAPPAGGALSLVYASDVGRPPAVMSGVSILITEFRGDFEPEFIGKILGPDATIEPVSIRGESGYWISGAPHEILYRNSDGSQPEELRLATDTLLWQHGPLLIRVEGMQTRQQALAIVDGMR